ncbi:MAG: hypothetical protein JO366_04085 [Methylobacteriaceae bacterium]|nr:hypothetical protein [Methylobacteriaceae bacterium]MBV9243972.1 hypothetical protein [Methylobacteriaceae bacterium]MBV9633158.1 hypothetical protein [Methylobacteriaceae bacterium]MBV9704229.1 hypothetical protein [Methylobacteriaceae bacterium]
MSRSTGCLHPLAVAALLACSWVLPAQAAASQMAANSAELRLGEYSCIGSGGQILIGLGFRALPGNKYVSLDNKDGGTYSYDADARTVTFVDGFLTGYVGENVEDSRFNIHGASCGPA